MDKNIWADSEITWDYNEAGYLQMIFLSYKVLKMIHQYYFIHVQRSQNWTEIVFFFSPNYERNLKGKFLNEIMFRSFVIPLQESSNMYELHAVDKHAVSIGWSMVWQA